MAPPELGDPGLPAPMPAASSRGRCWPQWTGPRVTTALGSAGPMCSAASRGAGPSDASPGNLNWQWPRRHRLRALVGHVRRASGACGGGLQGALQRAWASCLTLGFLGTRGTLCMQGSSLSLGFFSGEVLRITAVSRDGVVRRAVVWSLWLCTALARGVC